MPLAHSQFDSKIIHYYTLLYVIIHYYTLLYIIIRFSFMTDKLVPIPASAMERRKNLNTEVRNLYNIRKLQLLLDTL